MFRFFENAWNHPAITETESRMDSETKQWNINETTNESFSKQTDWQRDQQRDTTRVINVWMLGCRRPHPLAPALSSGDPLLLALKNHPNHPIASSCAKSACDCVWSICWGRARVLEGSSTVPASIHAGDKLLASCLDGLFWELSSLALTKMYPIDSWRENAARDYGFYPSNTRVSRVFF